MKIIIIGCNVYSIVKVTKIDAFTTRAIVTVFWKGKCGATGSILLFS